jgi:hypothetical protein
LETIHPWWRQPRTPWIKYVSPRVPFDRPVLRVLPILTNGTTARIAEARKQYSHDMEVRNLIEHTIIQQINTTIDEDCLTNQN